ncbi:MAG: hypothetical protein ACN4EU_01775 [Brevundimonas mediterranea]|jgi:hypothetical protein
MSGSAQCPHVDVHYHLNLASFGNTNVRYLEIKGQCLTCDAPIRFRAPLGLSSDHPTVSLDGAEVSLPLMFGDETYDGKASGYTLTVSP